MVWSLYPAKKSLVGGWVGGWQTKFNVSPGPGLWSLVLGPFGPDLGPDLDLTWDLDLDLSLTISDISIRNRKYCVNCYHNLYLVTNYHKCLPQIFFLKKNSRTNFY